jgi:hypothetical protein
MNADKTEQDSSGFYPRSSAFIGGQNRFWTSFAYPFALS